MRAHTRLQARSRFKAQVQDHQTQSCFLSDSPPGIMPCMSNARTVEAPACIKVPVCIWMSAAHTHAPAEQPQACAASVQRGIPGVLSCKAGPLGHFAHPLDLLACRICLAPHRSTRWSLPRERAKMMCSSSSRLGSATCACSPCYATAMAHWTPWIQPPCCGS